MKFKMCGKIKFHSDAPMLKYRHKSLNSFCFSSLASSCASIKQTNTANAISFLKEKLLKSKVGNHIDFANYILKNEKNLKVNQE